MAKGSAANSPASEKEKKAGRKFNWWKFVRRAGVAALAALVLLTVIFFLLPVWISNEQGRAYVLQRLNQRLLGSGEPGRAGAKISVNDWSLGWFRASEIKNLRVILADGTVVLSCGHIKSGMTLWDMFWGNYDLGSTNVDELELNVTRRTDGGSSLDALAGAGMREVLRAVRGSLRINGGAANVQSDISAQAARYSNVQCTITIAPEALIRVQLSAAGSTNAGAGWVPGDVSVDATLPSLRTLAGAAAGYSPWSLLSDVEFTAGNAPSGLLCEFLGQDAGWARALGPMLQTVRFSNHAAPGEAGRPVLLMHGTGGALPDTTVDLRLLFKAPNAGARGETTGGFIALPTTGTGSAAGAEDFHAVTALRLSPEVAELLRHVNPLLGAAKSADGTLVRATVTALNIPLNSQASADTVASARIVFPPLALTPEAGGLVDQLRRQLSAPGGSPATTAAGGLQASAGSVRVGLADGALSYENFIVTVEGARFIFSGSITLDGHVSLLAQIPGTASGGFSTQSAQFAVQGTIFEPRVLLPR